MERFESRMGVNTQLIHIVHADPLVHAGLLALLSQPSEWRVTPDESGDRQPDLLLADHATALALARARLGTTSLLVVTNLEREWQVRMALEAGVRGYVLQSGAVEELLHAVRQLLDGRIYVARALRDKLASSHARIALTRRETEVLQLLGEGSCNKLIARELGIGLGTVKTHVRSLMEKLGAHARTQAVVLAARHGLINPGLPENGSALV